MFGLPVIGHLGSRIVASDPIDSSQFMWFLAWWPHAVLHGLNPFVTHAMFVPDGFNLTWSTAMPGPGDRALADHRAVRSDGHLERDPARLAGAERVDHVSPVPPSDRADVAVAGRRIRVRVLALHADPPDGRPVPGAGRAAAGVRAARAAAAGGLDRPAPVRRRDDRRADRRVPDLERGARHRDAVRRDRARARLRACLPSTGVP